MFHHIEGIQPHLQLEKPDLVFNSSLNIRQDHVSECKVVVAELVLCILKPTDHAPCVNTMSVLLSRAQYSTLTWYVQDYDDRQLNKSRVRAKQRANMYMICAHCANICVSLTKGLD